jgi:hypothetical protein
MTDNCLDSKAQFRYLDTELLHNIEKDGTLVSARNNAYYNGRWAVYKGVTTAAISYQKSGTHRLKQTAAGSLFFYNRTDPVCAEPSSKYLLRKTYCNTTQQKFTFGKWNTSENCPILQWPNFVKRLKLYLNVITKMLLINSYLMVASNQS